VKLFCRHGSGTILGGVGRGAERERAGLPMSLAVQHSLTADQIAHTFSHSTPRCRGSLTEAARQLMLRS
jgi:dihydrolipoamide dehydrogenase